MRDYIKENEDLILDKKNQLLKILNAFMKAGTDLSKEVYPRMKYKGLYLPEFQNESHQFEYEKKDDHEKKDEEMA